MGNWISKLFQLRHRTQRSRNNIDIEHERSSEAWSHIEMPIAESTTSRPGEGDVQRIAPGDEVVRDVNTAATAPPGSQLATTLSMTTPGMMLAEFMAKPLVCMHEMHVIS